jgi:hypothetical protein
MDCPVEFTTVRNTLPMPDLPIEGIIKPDDALDDGTG